MAALVLLVAAAVGGLIASGRPDGLMYVAERTGLADSERPGSALVSGWAGHVVSGIAVLLVAAGLFRLLARRGDRERRDEDAA